MTDLGRDTSCTTSLRTGRIVSGARLVGEAIFRRITTPRGMLRGGEEEANYGEDISGLVGSTRPDLLIASLPGRLSAEIRKDERIEDVSVIVTSVRKGPSVELTVTIEATTSEGPFTLVVEASSVTAQLIGLEA
jgi:hypothetical protein